MLPLSVGHRGFGAGARTLHGVRVPENTLASFHTAIEQGAHGLETDVQVTLDGEFVIYHDDEIDEIAISTLTRDQLAARCDAHNAPLCSVDELLRLVTSAFLPRRESSAPAILSPKSPTVTGPACDLSGSDGDEWTATLEVASPTLVSSPSVFESETEMMCGEEPQEALWVPAVKEDRTFELVLELKNPRLGEKEIAREFVRFLHEAGYLPYVQVFSSFTHSVLRTFRTVLDELREKDSSAHMPRLGALFNRNSSALPEDYIERARACHASEIHVSAFAVAPAFKDTPCARGGPSGQDVLNTILANGFNVMVWFTGSVVESTEDLEALISMLQSASQHAPSKTLDAARTKICTNRPEVLAQLAVIS